LRRGRVQRNGAASSAATRRGGWLGFIVMTQDQKKSKTEDQK
jgi:hypothetical protein